jgi:hypothetical protein
MPVIERPCEVLMEDGTWHPGVIVRQDSDRALIRWAGIVTWFFRNQDDNEPDEWRPTDAR